MLEALQELETINSQNVDRDIADKLMQYKNTKDLVKKKIDQTAAEADDIKGEISNYKEKLSNLQSVLSTLKDKHAAESKALMEESEKYKMKQFDLSVQENLCKDLQKQLDKFQYNPKLCNSDKNQLAECRRKLNLYYQTTRIRWDYSAPESTVKGYVTNKSKTEAVPFEFSTDDGPVCEKLWGVLEQVVDTDWEDLEGSSKD
ncbi:uncharacterized protein LOC134533839 [Bacillus rossius redtenbacheri]|uniref:uncharacterized protein LOC134533839 n=1 Tax=Bacillus rossius redtenbacheri TaxID=93214 RepID=UPI002FDD6128